MVLLLQMFLMCIFHKHTTDILYYYLQIFCSVTTSKSEGNSRAHSSKPILSQVKKSHKNARLVSIFLQPWGRRKWDRCTAHDISQSIFSWILTKYITRTFNAIITVGTQHAPENFYSKFSWGSPTKFYCH